MTPLRVRIHSFVCALRQSLLVYLLIMLLIDAGLLLAMLVTAPISVEDLKVGWAAV
jgi:hypothetical protein